MMTRKDHIAIAHGIAHTNMDDDKRKELVLNVLEMITPLSKGLDRQLFAALAFLPDDVGTDLGE